MNKSKRIEVLDKRPVNLDGYISEWPEMGFAAMNSPYDPKPSVKVENGIITELDGKKQADFDFLDQFIADYAIRKDGKAPEAYDGEIIVPFSPESLLSGVGNTDFMMLN